MSAFDCCAESYGLIVFFSRVSPGVGIARAFCVRTKMTSRSEGTYRTEADDEGLTMDALSASSSIAKQLDAASPRRLVQTTLPSARFRSLTPHDARGVVVSQGGLVGGVSWGNLVWHASTTTTTADDIPSAGRRIRACLVSMPG